jgi:hypothetical protein
MSTAVAAVSTFRRRVRAYLNYWHRHGSNRFGGRPLRPPPGDLATVRTRANAQPKGPDGKTQHAQRRLPGRLKHPFQVSLSYSNEYLF